MKSVRLLASARINLIIFMKKESLFLQLSPFLEVVFGFSFFCESACPILYLGKFMGNWLKIWKGRDLMPVKQLMTIPTYWETTSAENRTCFKQAVMVSAAFNLK